MKNILLGLGIILYSTFFVLEVTNAANCRSITNSRSYICKDPSGNIVADRYCSRAGSKPVAETQVCRTVCRDRDDRGGNVMGRDGNVYRDETTARREGGGASHNTGLDVTR